VQVLTILLATRACGLAVRRLGQPHVVGEMLAGILLGPSLLGLLAPGASSALFPPSSLEVLSALSEVGMVLYMFLVGMDLDADALRERRGAALLTSHVSIALPFSLGAALSLGLYDRFAPPGIPFTPFALFLGAAMSVTAFPVLARILAERGLGRTPLGALATSAAAVDDVTAWSILAAIMVVVRTAGGGGVPLVPVLGIVLFVAGAWLVRRPLRRQAAAAFEARGGMTHALLATLVALALAGAAVTQALGLHALFGAFFAGFTLSTERRVAQAARERLEGPLVVLLVPLYFTFTGLRTRARALGARPRRGGGRYRRQAGGLGPRRAGRRRAVAGGGGAGDPDEHARPDGARDPERGPRPGRPLSRALLDLRADGLPDHADDEPALVCLGCPGKGGARLARLPRLALSCDPPERLLPPSSGAYCSSPRPDRRTRMATIGLIGAGHIGSQIARLAVANGYNVVISNSRGPQTLSALVKELGAKAHAGTALEAAKAGDIVVVSIPLKSYRQVPVEPLAGKVVIDTNNYYPERDGHIPELDSESKTTSELLQAHLPESKVVKAFNHIYAAELTTHGQPVGSKNRRALVIAGDDPAAKETVTHLLDQFGFDTVDAGPLREGWRIQRDTPGYGPRRTAEELRRDLAAAKRYADR